MNFFHSRVIALILFINSSSLWPALAVEARPTEHAEPAGENGTTTGTREHEQQEEEAREQQKAAEALRLRNLNADHATTSSLPNAPHTFTTILPPDNTTISAPVTTVAGEGASNLTGISAEGAERIRAIGRGEHDFSTPSRPGETPQEKTRRENKKKTLAYLEEFQKELTAWEKESPKNQRLKGNEIADLKMTLMDATINHLNDPEAIQAEISELLQKAKRMSKENSPAPIEKPVQKEEPAQPKLPLTPEQRQIIADAIARGKASPEFALTKQILSDFEQELETRTSLDLMDRFNLKRELEAVVLKNPRDSSAIEQKKSELFEKADRLNLEREQAKKITQDEKAVQEKAAREKAAHEASEAARIKVLKKTLMDTFEQKLLIMTRLLPEDQHSLYRQFEQAISKNPDATDAINAKSTELLKEADKLNEKERLAAERAVYEKAERARQEEARQNERPLETAINTIASIDSGTATALHNLKTSIDAKIENATVDQMIALLNIIKNVTESLPKDKPYGKTLFGKPTGKWSRDQKKQAQSAVDAANSALANAFPEEKTTSPASSAKTKTTPQKLVKAPEQPKTTPKTSPVRTKPWRQKFLEALRKTFKSPRKTN